MGACDAGSAGSLLLQDVQGPLTIVLSIVDTRTKCSLMATCKALQAILLREEHWCAVSFEEDREGLTAMQLVSVLKRAKGRVHTLTLARSEDARAAELQHRINSGVKLGMALPHTRGLRAVALAALCPNLQRLSLDERASCIGGMTNDLARALATHCRRLQELEVYFERYSPPSELFSDDGLIAISERCRQLRTVVLHNADQVSDRSLYALAANCCSLTRLALAGYNENITDGGLTILFEACPDMLHVRLSSKLLKVTDAAGASLSAHCPRLRSVKMTRCMTDATLRQLARGCPELQLVDARRCRDVSAEGVLALLGACPRLQRLQLPAGLALGRVVVTLPRCQLQVLVEEEEVLQQTLVML